MGVPTFYRYIHEKFPKAVRDYIEVMPDGLDAATEADWSAEPNPNGIEVDNLYLDGGRSGHCMRHARSRPWYGVEFGMFKLVYVEVGSGGIWGVEVGVR